MKEKEEVCTCEKRQGELWYNRFSEEFMRKGGCKAGPLCQKLQILKRRVLEQKNKREQIKNFKNFC